METALLYVTTFLEGIISFISPCMLPMLPVYVSYFASSSGGKKSSTLLRAGAFVAGFTAIFCLMGLLAGSLGAFLARYGNVLNVVCGIVIIFFGLSYLEIIRLPFFKGVNISSGKTGVLSAFLFGLVFSVNLTPCIGAFLGSALMLASSSGTAIKGLVMLLVYSLGLGIPFIASALILEKLRSAISFIKRHYKLINTICGVFLIVIGISMIFGVFGRIIKLFAF